MNGAVRDTASVLLDIEGDVARLTLNRPERMNAMDLGMVSFLGQTVKEVADSNAKVVVITGAGRGFCSGEDLKVAAEAEPDEMLAFIEALQAATTRLLDLEIPTVAAVNGPAIGGGAELVLACDWKIAIEQATFSFPETSLGVIVTGGGLSLLEAHVGRATAMELLLGGERIDAHRAKQSGLVTEVAEADSFSAAVESRAARLANLPQSSVAAIKRSLRELHFDTIEKAMAIESAAIKRLYEHPDAKALATQFGSPRGGS